MRVGNIETNLYFTKGYLHRSKQLVRVLGVELDKDGHEVAYWVKDLHHIPDIQKRVERKELYPVLDEKPEGWRWCEGALTAPNGYKWAAHGSLFWRTNGRERYEHAIIPIR